jgi:hypothetical protein
MQYNQPYGVSDPNAPYINGNVSTGIQGSIPPAASIEYPQREIVNLISDGGFTPSNGDLRQLGRSLQSGHIWYGIDTGVKNAVQINLTPPPLAYYDGMFVWVLPVATNDGPSNINLNALGARTIVRRGGGDLVAGDLPAGYKSLLCYSALHTNFELYGINFTGGTTGFLPILTQNTNLYVNQTTGSDTLYDGSSATVVGPGSPKAGPFKTINRAINETWKYGPSVYTMTINISAGTYAESIWTPSVVGPHTIFNGAGIAQTYITSLGSVTYAAYAQSANQITVQNMHLANNYANPGYSIFLSQTGAWVTAQNVAVGSCPSGYTFFALGGYMSVGTCSFDSGTQTACPFYSYSSGNLYLTSAAVYTFNGPITVGTGYFATCSANANLSVATPAVQAITPIWVNTGYVTAAYKYSAALNGVINSQGAGVNFFPGTNPGVTNTGGQYGP